MNFKINIDISAIISIAALFVNPILCDAKPAARPFIAPVMASPAESENIDSLIKDLESKDNSIRSHAIEALSKIGEPAVPFIIKALTDSNSHVRRGAAETLGNIRTVTPEIIPSLTKSLTDSDNNVRKVAAEALEKRGAMTAELKALRYIRDLGDSNSNSDARVCAVAALDKIGPITSEVIPAIIMGLVDSDYLVRKSSAEFLDKRGSLTDSLKAERHIADLKYGKSAVRIKALESLGKLGAITPDVVPSIIKALEDKEACDMAIKALGSIGPAAKSAIPSLTKALSDSDSNIRAEAVEALGNIGPAAKSATPSLMKALKDNDSTVRTKTAETLKKLGVMSARDKISYLTFSHPILAAVAGICVCLALLLAGWFAVPVLWKFFFPLNWYIRELHNPQNERRVLASEALARIGNSSIPFLIKMLENKNRDIRISAAEALNEFRSLPPEAITLILKSMKDKEDDVRRNIIGVFGKAGPATSEVVLVLIRALEDGNSGVRASAAEILGKNGALREAVPALKKAIEDNNCQVRHNAFNSLEKCGFMTTEIKVKRLIADLKDNNIDISDKAKEELTNIGTVAIPELIKTLGHGESHVRRFAASLLEQHEALTVDIKVKRFIVDLRDSQPSVLTKAAKALGDIGPEASEAIPHLIKLIVNNDFYVRMYAAQALGKLGALSYELKVKRYNLDLADSNGYVQSEVAEGIVHDEKTESPI